MNALLLLLYNFRLLVCFAQITNTINISHDKYAMKEDTYH